MAPRNGRYVHLKRSSDLLSSWSQHELKARFLNGRGSETQCARYRAATVRERSRKDAKRLIHFPECYDCIYGMQYEWDEEKDRINQEKHGISFPIAALVFEDERCLVFLDRIDDAGEQRWHAVGAVSIEPGTASGIASRSRV